MRKTLLSLSLLFMTIATIQAEQHEKLFRLPMKKVEATMQKKARAAAAQQTWKESFEDWDGKDYFWLPDGWSRKCSREDYMDSTNPYTWFVNTQTNVYTQPAPLDGKVYAEVMYNLEPQDEWLYTSEHAPKEGDWLSYYVTLVPFNLFTYSDYDKSTATFKKFTRAFDMETYISVDGGEWQLFNSLFETYKADGNFGELYDLAHEGYVSNRKMMFDMKEYVGHSIRLAFHYVSDGDGDSMWLDDVQLAPLSLKAEYKLPSTTMYFGMTKDFEQPSSYIYLPDNATLTWTNASSLEATSFDWTYADTKDLTKTATKTNNGNLITTYKTYTPVAEQKTGLENQADVPTLVAHGIGGLEAAFKHRVGKMQLGGKAYTTVDGTLYETGASYCNPKKGYDVLLATDGTPYFGVSPTSVNLWTRMFGLNGVESAKVVGFGTEVLKPAKPYTLRGAWIQGVGKIDKAHKLSLSIRHLDPLYGGWEEEPLGTAVIDIQNIKTMPIEGSDYMIYTIPFVFPDPVTVNKQVWVMIDGLSEAAEVFMPMQTLQPEEEELQSHAVFEVYYDSEDYKDTGIYYASNLSLKNENGEAQQCNYNFFFNLDMAYGDCDDWGHVDMEQPLTPMPEMPVTDNRLYVLDVDSEEDMASYPVRCGFYDEQETTLRLWNCVGELYETEGGPFYSDDVNNTLYLKLSIPQELVGDTVTIGTEGVDVSFYSMYSHSVEFTATRGKLCVKHISDNIYDVFFLGFDDDTQKALSMKFCVKDQWRWRNYNEERPNPSQYELKLSGKVNGHSDILSCVADLSNAEIPVFYLADTEGLTTVEAVKALGEKTGKYVVISMPVQYNADGIKGFSVVRNDDMYVIYNGVKYNYSSVSLTNDEVAYGGNVQLVEFDVDARFVNINSTIFTMISEGYNSLYLHFDGHFAIDNAADGISSVTIDNTADMNIYDLQGRKVTAPVKGQLYIMGGKKIVR